MSTTDQLIDSFAAMVNDHGVPFRKEDNHSRLEAFQQKLAKRLPQSFESLLSWYSFPTFDVLGITLFDWDSDSNKYVAEASAPKNSLSELLIPAGYVQIGRPDTRVVQVDHEDILCNWKVRVTGELWPSFVKLVESALSSDDPQVYLRGTD